MLQWLSPRRQEINIDEEVEKRHSLHIISRNVNWGGAATMENSMQASQKKKKFFFNHVAYRDPRPGIRSKA